MITSVWKQVTGIFEGHVVIKMHNLYFFKGNWSKQPGLQAPGWTSYNGNKTELWYLEKRYSNLLFLASHALFSQHLLSFFFYLMFLEDEGYSPNDEKGCMRVRDAAWHELVKLQTMQNKSENRDEEIEIIWELLVEHKRHEKWCHRSGVRRADLCSFWTNEPI